MESEYRKLDQREREILLKLLLEENVAGREAFLSQIDSLSGRDAIPGEFLDLRCSGGQRGPNRTPLTEASCHDADGTQMSVLLHVRDGYLSVLETLRYGDGPIQRLPQASDLEIPPAY